MWVFSSFFSDQFDCRSTYRRCSIILAKARGWLYILATRYVYGSCRVGVEGVYFLNPFDGTFEGLATVAMGGKMLALVRIYTLPWLEGWRGSDQVRLFLWCDLLQYMSDAVRVGSSGISCTSQVPTSPRASYE